MVKKKRKKGRGVVGSETFTFLLHRRRRRNRNLTGNFLSKGQILLLSDVYNHSMTLELRSTPRQEGRVGGLRLQYLGHSSNNCCLPSTRSSTILFLSQSPTLAPLPSNRTICTEAWQETCYLSRDVRMESAVVN